MEGSGVNCLTASSMVGALAWYGCTHIVERPNTLSPSVHPPVKIRRKATSLLNLFGLPQALRLVREESSDWVMEVTWKCSNIGQIDWKASPPLCRVLGEKCIIAHGELYLQEEDMFS